MDVISACRIFHTVGMSGFDVADSPGSPNAGILVLEDSYFMTLSPSVVHHDINQITVIVGSEETILDIIDYCYTCFVPGEVES